MRYVQLLSNDQLTCSGRDQLIPACPTSESIAERKKRRGEAEIVRHERRKKVEIFPSSAHGIPLFEQWSRERSERRQSRDLRKSALGRGRTSQTSAAHSQKDKSDPKSKEMRLLARARKEEGTMFSSPRLLFCLLAARLVVRGQVVEPSNDTARLLPDNQLQLVVRTSATGRRPPTVASLYPLTSRAGLNQSIEFLEVINFDSILPVRLSRSEISSLGPPLTLSRLPSL